MAKKTAKKTASKKKSKPAAARRTLWYVALFPLINRDVLAPAIRDAFREGVRSIHDVQTHVAAFFDQALGTPVLLPRDILIQAMKEIPYQNGTLYDLLRGKQMVTIQETPTIQARQGILRAPAPLTTARLSIHDIMNDPEPGASDTQDAQGYEERRVDDDSAGAAGVPAELAGGSSDQPPSEPIPLDPNDPNDLRNIFRDPNETPIDPSTGAPYPNALYTMPPTS